MSVIQVQDLYPLLERVKVYASNGVSPQDEDFAECRSQVLDFFGTNATHTISLLNSLDLNDSIYGELIDFFPDIVSNFEDPSDKDIFIRHVESLQEQYPNVDFSQVLLFLQLDYDINEE